MIKTFVGETTLHGLRYVFLSPTRIRRLIWLILLLASTVAYVVIVEQSFAKYYSDPVSTEFMEFVPEDGMLQFPAVTICNLNRFVKTKIDLQEDNANFYKLGLNLSACEVIREVNTGLTCGQALLCAFEDFGTAVVDNCSETTRERIIEVLNNTKEPVFNPEEFMATYGHDFSAMFLHYCRFAIKEKCTSDDFLPILSKNGLCYTFNSGRNDTKVRSTRLGGSSGGLSVILDVEANESTISEFSRGLRVMIHHQGTFVDWDNGFNVLPGSHTLVSMIALKHNRLPPPYRSACTQRSLPLIANYTKDGCYLQCQANMTIAMCGCRTPGVPAVPSNLPVCSFQHEYCFDQTLSTLNLRKCSCGVPCTAVEYLSQISYSQFPHLGLSKVFEQMYGYDQSLDYQRKNLVFLQVAFRHLEYQVTKEIPSYGLDNLLGNIGGNMGLFMGCSLLTLFEFVDLAWCLLQRRMNRVKNTSKEDEEATA